MKIAELIDEAALEAMEREQWAANLERSIAFGHVKRPLSDVTMMRSRFPAMRAIVRALKLLAVWRDKLPEEFIAEIERAP
jgi:hypothetical protein